MRIPTRRPPEKAYSRPNCPKASIASAATDRGARTSKPRAARPRPEAIRRAIVNPARLSRERQLDVCMQCHLETTSRPLPNVVARFEHGPFDYRPGQPLTDYFLFFDRRTASAKNENFEIAHAAYRLRKSKCFQASQMTCATCHNPHDVPRGQDAAARYNAACRKCHAAAHRAGVPGGGNCASCHMPRRRTTDEPCTW